MMRFRMSGKVRGISALTALAALGIIIGSCTDTVSPPIQNVSGKPYFRGTNDVSADPSQPQFHVHLRFTQSGNALGRPADCEPLPDANCDVLPRNSAGTTAIGPLDDQLIAATVTQITGTFTDPGISFTFTLQNGRTFSFTGTVTNSNTMSGTMSGATLPAPTTIVLSRSLEG